MPEMTRLVGLLDSSCSVLWPVMSVERVTQRNVTLLMLSTASPTITVGVWLVRKYRTHLQKVAMSPRSEVLLWILSGSVMVIGKQEVQTDRDNALNVFQHQPIKVLHCNESKCHWMVNITVVHLVLGQDNGGVFKCGDHWVSLREIKNISDKSFRFTKHNQKT